MLNYKTVNGYQIPDLKIPDEQVTLGRYGRMRKAYLKEHRKMTFNSLLLAGALKENNVPFELHLFTHGGHGSSTCTNEVNTPNKHNNAWLPLCMGWLGETLDFTL